MESDSDIRVSAYTQVGAIEERDARLVRSRNIKEIPGGGSRRLGGIGAVLISMHIVAAEVVSVQLARIGSCTQARAKWAENLRGE